MADKIIIQTPSLFKVDDSFSDERFERVRIAVMHSGENLNHSYFDTEVIREAKDSFAGIPILANTVTYTDKDGNTVVDYGGHDAHIEEDLFNKGENKLIYDERVVGFIPETCNFEIVHDDESDKDFAYVDGYLYTEYGNYAVDILKSRNNTTSVSAEIYLDEISFDAKNDYVVVNKMRMSGVTLLGADVNPAMKGANATAFSLSDDDRQSQLITIIRELTEALDKYNASIPGNEISEEGGLVNVDKFNELLEQYGKTVDDVTFEYEGLSDEELEAKFAEVFTSEEDPHAEDDGVEQDAEVKFTAEYNGKFVEMSVSLKDKINALYELVNDTYADDGTWYDVDVFDEDKYVIMVDYWNGKGFKQNYKVKKDVYTLVGDRVEVFAQWLTQDEINKLDKMKSDFAEISEKLGKYEDEPKKMEILTSEDYSLIANDEEFIALCEQSGHFDMSIDDVTKKADEILTNAAKAHKFSANGDSKPISVKPLPDQKKKKTKRFGSLFDGII